MVFRIHGMKPNSLPTPSAARAFLVAAVAAMSGCPLDFGPAFVPGNYVGDVPCTLGVQTADGQTGEEVFIARITLAIDDNGDMFLDGVAVAVGNEVVRSIPTADLAFEITRVALVGNLLTIEFEPRPTLPGITVEDELVETYRWDRGSIEASAEADLIVTDVSGPNTFTINCDGVLTG
jgi:hypothetical protein